MKIMPLLSAFVLMGIFLSCDDDVPAEEQSPEVITKVQLLFDPKSGGSPIVVTAVDEDGLGPKDLEPSGAINLAVDEEYELFVTLENTLTQESITEEVAQEADEHMFFFGFTAGLFESPEGSGNIGDRSAQVNYLDQDGNGLPLGLNTAWIASAEATSGEFRLVLKHQPDGIKSETSESTSGETDVNISWVINIE